MRSTHARAAVDGPEPRGLVRALGLWDVTTITAGTILGSAIFVMAERGGFVSLDDLRAYRSEPAPIVRTTYRGRDVAALGGRAWGDTLVEMLNIFDEFKLDGEPSAIQAEILARVMHHPLEDRPQELGTLKPKPSGYPLSTLSSRAFARDRAAAIRRALTTGTVPAGALANREWHDTTHLAVMDGDGNAVSLTTSIGTPATRRR